LNITKILQSNKIHPSYYKYKSIYKNCKKKRLTIDKKVIKKNILNNKSKPLVSIITVVKDSSTYIEKTIKSVLTQSYRNIEYIIIEGKSKDNSLLKIKKFREKLSIILSEKDNGIFDAMNKGIILSKGSIIGIINSGDIFKKNAVYTVVNNINNYDYIFGPVKKNRILFNYKPNQINYKFNIFPSHSVSFFIKKRIHLELGLYNINFKLSADNDFIYKLIKNKKKYRIFKTNNIFGECQPHNFSKKFSLIDHLTEEMKIRIGNRQNLFFVFGLFFTKLIYSFFYFFRNFFSRL